MYKCECGKKIETLRGYRSHFGKCRVVKGEKWYQEYKIKVKESYDKNNFVKRGKELQEIKEKQLQEWLNSNPKCERCNKLMTERYATGRFCNSKCARGFSTKEKREEINRKVSAKNKGLPLEGYVYDKPKDTRPRNVQCPYCDYLGKSDFNISYHINQKHKELHEKTIANKLYVSKNKKTNVIFELNITNKELENYREETEGCEICGKEYSHIIPVHSRNKKESKAKLAVDHCHKTNEFRGLLCVSCNRSLGWLETQEEKINKYRNKKHWSDI